MIDELNATVWAKIRSYFFGHHPDIDWNAGNHLIRTFPEDVIERLNNEVWCKLGPSKIDGVGVIAIRDIPKGQCIFATRWPQWWQCTDFTGLHPAILELIKQRWPHALKGDLFLSPSRDARLVSFMNSSDTPNYDYATDCVTRDIKAGEEITETLDGVYIPSVV